MLDLFTVTNDHLKLVARLNIGECDGEASVVPCVDPKRPYGNTAFLEDIHEILTGEAVGLIGGSKDSLTSDERDRAFAIHRDMPVVLQIVCAAKSFEPGVYVCDWPKSNWRKAKDTTTA